MKLDISCNFHSYSYWIKLFFLYQHKRHPTEFGDAEIKDFLGFPAARLRVDPESGFLRRHHCDENNRSILVNKVA